MRHSLSWSLTCWTVLTVALLAAGLAQEALAEDVDARCPAHATIGTDSEGRLLVCAEEGREVHIGGISAELAALRRDNDRLTSEISALRANQATLEAMLQEFEWNPFSGVLEVATNVAFDWEHFEIDGDHFLAVANFYDGDSRSHVTGSHLYKYDNATGLFNFETPWQSVTTKGAYDWEHFEIDSDHFLAAANHRDGLLFTTESHIYKYDNFTGLFDFDTPWQSVSTNGALDWEHFEIGDDHFLAVANYQSDSSTMVESHIYKYNSRAERFDVGSPWQTVATKGATDSEHFQIGGDHFLAVANCFDGTSHTLDSHIYKYNISTRLFDFDTPWQTASTYCAYDWEHFAIAGDHFLAVANYRDGDSYTIDSHIYKYEKDSGLFDFDKPWQTIATKAAVDWEYFTTGGNHFLAVANYLLTANLPTTESHIYKYDPLTKQFNIFSPFKTLTLTNAACWKAFPIARENRFFVAVACEPKSFVFVSSLV